MPNGKNWNRLADLVLRERQKARITQRQLADRMGVDVRSVRRIEAGQSVAKKTVAAIDDAFDLPTGTARSSLEQEHPPQQPRGREAVNRILTMTRDELFREAEAYDEVEPGAGDRWIRWVMSVRERAWEQEERRRTRAEQRHDAD
ncbi:helix-turn-helix domain-containing protein [Prauserella endophytica]|uniref:helix-turn-helix domain-containing protein n=1 Tax=Prauserella endophytica TaxID=1592324 RepID=UPI0013054533|nr:helix-turn-helix transcriptional regulator [Prauserella endophytica]